LVRNILDKLTVVCPNNAYCDQLMPRHTLEVHLKYQCSGTYIPCPREENGCDYMGPRCQLEEHLWSCSHGSDLDPNTGTKQPIEEGKVTTIEIPKGKSELGLSYCWCDDVGGGLLIEEIFPEGNAYFDGRLIEGDIIMQIDRQELSHMSLAQATLALSTSSPLLTLTVYRPAMEDAETELVELEKREGQPLGIQIRTSRTRPGIYVHYLVPGSKAEECGNIKAGDRILEVNGRDLRDSSVDEAAAFMTEESGTLKFLIARQDLAFVHSSASSDSSSVRCNSSPTGISPSTGGPIYDEIRAPSGYPIGSPKSVCLKKKADESFGMNVAGGTGGTAGDLPIFISAIKQDSVIGCCGKIQRGDILLSINDRSLVGKTHTEAIESVRRLMGCEVVRMELIQGEDMDINGGLSPDWGKWLTKWEAARRSPSEFSVTLKKDGQKSLGFSIVGGRNSSRGHCPLFIRSIAPNSIASEDGRLHSGDKISQINGTAVVHMSQNEVVQLIKISGDTITLCVIPRDH
jgi:C-terminal processing protease CtpA/Prc